MRCDSTRRRRARRGLSWGLAAATALTIGGGLALGAPATAAGCDGVWRVTTGKTPPSSQVRDLVALSPTELWSAGALVPSGPGYVSRWRAGTLTTMRLPDISFVSLLAGTAKDMYAVGPDAMFADRLYHYDGSRWTQVPGLDAVLGEFGSVNAMEVRDGVLYIFAVRFNQAGAITITATWDGARWTALPHNLADSAYAVPLASAVSPSGEVWVAGEDVLFTQDHPIWRKPWIGKLVGGRFVRQTAPKVPQLTSTMPGTITFDAAGRPVVSGWTGEDFVTGMYPFSATRRGTGWALDTIPAPVAQNTTVSDSATIGGRVFTSSWALILDQEWVSLSARGTKGFGNPINLAGHAGEMPFAMTGLPTGEGYLAGRTSGDATRLWTVCGAGGRSVDPSGATGVSGDSTGTALPAGGRAGVPSAALGARPGAAAGARAWTLPSLAARVATARQARTGHDVTALDGLISRAERAAARPAATGSGGDLTGPAIDRLRAATRAGADARFVARDACADDPGRMRCLAQVVTQQTADGQRDPVTGYPAGYGPTEYRSAYGLPASGGKGRTVGISIAYHHPNLPADLAAYRAATGMKPCTTANGCLRVVGQTGGKPPTTTNDGWALEAALDVQTVSAACPDCKILLVEANSPSDSDLGQANKTAARLGAWVVSNSFGRDEATSDPQTASGMLPGSVPLVAATGDWGHGAIYPSTIPAVIGVGGTRLLEAPGSPRGWQESIWNFSGGGCSAVQARPAWQRAANCFGATAATTSLSAVADPATGAAVYFTPQDPAIEAGWYVVGGTSLSAPLVAGISAVTGKRLADSTIWSGGAATIDIRTGGRTGWCSPAWECTAVRGYDAVTGFGVPRS